MTVLLLVGTAKGVFIAESDGDRSDWEVRGPYAKGWKAYSVTADTRGGKPVLWAGLASDVYGPHLQRSDDLGRTWVAVDSGPRFADGGPRKLRQIWALQPGPGDGTLYAGVAEAALFESRDGGATWTLNQGLEQHPTRERWAPGAGGLCLHTVLLDPKNPKRQFVGISAVGMLRSDDGGRSWQVRNEGVKPVALEESPKYPEIGRCLHKMVQDPQNPNHLYQQNHTGVYRTRDAGDHWERIENGLPSNFGFPIVMHPRDSRTLYVIPQESDEFRLFNDGRVGVYRTRSGGDSWHAVGRGLPADNYAGVLRDAFGADSLDPAGLYFGTSSGQLFASADEGESWRLLPAQFPRILAVRPLAL